MMWTEERVMANNVFKLTLKLENTSDEEARASDVQ